MAINSAEIAGAQGQFQSLYAAQYQHSSFLSGVMGMAGPPPMQAEAITGGAMNRIGAVAGPLAGLGLGMMGLDPVSLGMKAGMGAYRAGAGFMGSAAAGLGVAGAAAIPLALAGFASNQMMQGAGQQQGFNSAMRQSFPFNQGFGQGFSTTQLGAMGSDIRGMVGQVGPAGEMSSFHELSSLAANMGRMGMATGVRDVQQFSQKFREMVQTIKTVATELGTSLEQAQQAMASMRGSGVFKAADQVKMATQIRGYSISGGLATSELAAMGSIGSQISRSVGGRGNAGAFAGMKTLGTIGSALQTGVLNDEDIYNATGMYGAEGRQALATRQMELSSSFLRSNKGRYFLASVAGSNGQLDEASVSSWMGGGMDVEETRGQAHRNLRGVGRANFIRNEGRLRGAAMEKFGGLLPAMAMQQWAQGKGVDINNMGDREMLFASRQLGMGMDELEATLKEARNLPALMQSQQTEGQIDQGLRTVANRRRTQGIEGMKRQFEQAREKVQGGLQSLGADFYTQTSDMVERWINKMSGTYVDEINRDAIRAYKESGNLSDFQARTGIGRANRFGGAARPGSGGISASSEFFGEGGMSGGGVAGLASFGLGGAIGSFLRGDTGYDRAVKAGFGSVLDPVRGMRAGAGREVALGKASTFMNEFFSNMANPNLSGQSFGFSSGMQDKMREAYAGGLAEKHGLDRANALQGFLEGEAAKGSTEARAALLQLRNAPDSQKGAIALGIERSGKVSSGSQISAGAAETSSLFGGAYASRGEQAEAAGNILGTDKGGISGWKIAGTALLATSVVGAGLAVGLGIKGLIDHVQNTAKRQKAGEFMLSSAGQEFTRALASGSSADIDKAFNKVQDQYTDLRSRGEGNTDEAQRIKMMYAAAMVTKRAQAAGKSVFDKDIIKSVAGSLPGVSEDDLGTALTSVGKTFTDTQNNEIRSIARATRGGAQHRLDEINASGIIGRRGSTGVDASLQSYIRQAREEAGLSGAVGAEASDAMGEMSAFQEQRDRMNGYWNKSTSALRTDVKAREKLGLYGASQEERSVLSEKQRIAGQMRRGGAAGAVLQTLGLAVNRENYYSLKGASGDNVSSAVQAMMDKAGVGGAGMDDLRTELTTALTTKDKNLQARTLSDIQRGVSKGGLELLDEKKKQSEQEQREKNPILDSIDKTLAQMLDVSKQTQPDIKQMAHGIWQLNDSSNKDGNVKDTNSAPWPGGPT